MIAKILIAGRFVLVAATPLLRDATLFAMERLLQRIRERFENGLQTLDSPPAWEFPDIREEVPASTLPWGPSATDSHATGLIEQSGGVGGNHVSFEGRRPVDSMMERITHPDNLMRAWRRVATKRHTSAGADRQTLAAYGENLEKELQFLSMELREGRYQPRPLRCWEKDKGDGRKRVIAVPTIRDRVAQGAICQIMELVATPARNPWSFAYQSGKGCHEALAEVDRLLASGGGWVVRADVEECFDRVPHEPLLAQITDSVAKDPLLLVTLENILKGPRLLGKKMVFPRCGVPQGSPLSPLLANLFLDPVDHALREAGYQYLRYADDLIVVCDARTQAEVALAAMEHEFSKRSLRLNPKKSLIVDVSAGSFDFLGHRFSGGAWQAIPERVERLKSTINRAVLCAQQSGASGLAKANTIMDGWKSYYQRQDAVPQNLRRWFDQRTARLR